MNPSEEMLVEELEGLYSFQHRIDRVAEDLISGNRRYAEIDSMRLGELLGIEFGSCDGWGMGRGWALKKNIPDTDFSPESKREFKWTEKLNHYSWYEAQAEDCLFKAGNGLQEFMGWCSLLTMDMTVTSSGGFHFSFKQITDGVNFEAISPYIDDIGVDERELFELRFVLASELLHPADSYSTYIPEMDCDESEIWPAYKELTENELEYTRQQIQSGIIPVAIHCHCRGGCSVVM
jgi:hypothetical protein